MVSFLRLKKKLSAMALTLLCQGVAAVDGVINFVQTVICRHCRNKRKMMTGVNRSKPAKRAQELLKLAGSAGR
jgi:hypothetical protein